MVAGQTAFKASRYRHRPNTVDEAGSDKSLPYLTLTPHKPFLQRLGETVQSPFYVEPLTGQSSEDEAADDNQRVTRLQCLSQTNEHNCQT